ncbi:MAG: FAD-binding oxidoreductase [Oligoflexales bacterium]|nr:FAD-binding oxidoreductase [Oligoflexales bacterium]
MQKIAIIGSGIVGLNTAYHLLKKGYKTDIFSVDKRQVDYQPTSNAAIVVSIIKGLNVARSAFFQEKIDGHFELAQLAEELKLKINFGAQEYFFSNDDEARIKKRVFKKEFYGALNMELKYGPNEATIYRAPTFGSFIYHDDYFVDSQILLQKLKDSCISLGADFCEDKIENIDIYKQKELKFKLKTRNNSYGFNRVVVAAGEYTEGLLKEFNYDLPVSQKVAGHTLVFKGSEKQAPELIVDGKKTCVVSEGKIYYGSTSFSLTQDEKTNSLLIYESAESLKSEFYEKFRFSENKNPLLETRYGVRVKVRGNEPVIKCIYAENEARLILAYGFYKNGFQLAASSARKIEKMLREV